MKCSGSMHGLMRVRGFTQDDAHIFCTEDQIESECASFITLLSQRLQGPWLRQLRDQAVHPARRAHRLGRDLGQGRRRAGKRHQEDSANAYEIDPGDGRVLRPEAGLQADRRHRARMAVRHLPGGPEPADAAGRGICRRGWGQAPALHAAPRDPWVVRTLHRHPDRKLRRASCRSGWPRGRSSSPRSCRMPTRCA